MAKLATDLLSRKEVSAYLASKGVKMTTSTLAQYATSAKAKGKGPPYYRFGEKGARRTTSQPTWMPG